MNIKVSANNSDVSTVSFIIFFVADVNQCIAADHKKVRFSRHESDRHQRIRRSLYAASTAAKEVAKVATCSTESIQLGDERTRDPRSGENAVMDGKTSFVVCKSIR